MWTSGKESTVRSATAALFLLITLFLNGCGGMTPVELRNNREEGPEKGLFSGSNGEFILWRKSTESAVDEESDPQQKNLKPKQ